MAEFRKNIILIEFSSRKPNLCLYRFFSYAPHLTLSSPVPPRPWCLLFQNFCAKKYLHVWTFPDKLQCWFCWVYACWSFLAFCVCVGGGLSHLWLLCLYSDMVPGALILRGSCFKLRGTFTFSTFPPPREKLCQLHVLSSPLSFLTKNYRSFLCACSRYWLQFFLSRLFPI